MMKSTAFTFAAMLLATAAALGAGTHLDHMSVDNGHELARTLCRSCHAVEPRELVGPFEDVPTFTAVARLPSTTATALRVFLTTPHGDMPDIRLKPDQIQEIVDYILSLKDEH